MNVNPVLQIRKDKRDNLGIKRRGAQHASGAFIINVMHQKVDDGEFGSLL